MDDAITWVFENMTLATLLLALTLGAIGARRKKNASAGGWEPTVFWLMLLFVGVSGLYTGILHLAWPAQAAASIGWATSPFQWEVGMATLRSESSAAWAPSRAAPSGGRSSSR